ncbi:MAG: DUF1080 domain-containing protein, partial [Limisphaerales bacterium]
MKFASTRSFRFLVAAAFASLASLALIGCSTTGQRAGEGFTPLFNGRDLAGWRGGSTFDHRKLLAMTPEQRAEQIKKWTAPDQKSSMMEVSAKTGRPHWYVENGELVNDGFGAYASTEKDYGDFELLVDYKTVPLADSGIYLRGVPQVQIWDYTEEKKFAIGANKGSGGLW